MKLSLDIEVKDSIKKQLQNHLKKLISNGTLTQDNKDYWHTLAFNQDFIEGSYQAKKWLRKHNVDVFDAIHYVDNRQIAECGKSFLSLSGGTIVTAFTLANWLVYYIGKDLLSEEKDELLSELEVA